MNTYEEFKTVQLELDKKGQFTYASWSTVWEEVLKIDPNATCRTINSDSGFPAFINSTGGMVCVEVTINNVSKQQWMAITDYNNRAITKDKITSFDLNKAIQRGMVKAVALFGLGLYVYKGEDLPEQPIPMEEL